MRKGIVSIKLQYTLANFEKNYSQSQTFREKNCLFYIIVVGENRILLKFADVNILISGRYANTIPISSRRFVK